MVFHMSFWVEFSAHIPPKKTLVGEIEDTFLLSVNECVCATSAKCNCNTWNQLWALKRLKYLDPFLCGHHTGGYMVIWDTLASHPGFIPASQDSLQIHSPDPRYEWM